MLALGSDPQRALAFASGDEPEVALARARALHAVGDRAGALVAYDGAVRGNPTLEDPDLRSKLAASETVHAGPGNAGPRPCACCRTRLHH